MNELIARLRGNYSIPVNDGAGPLNGKMTVERHFDPLPICVEAADALEAQQKRIEELERECRQQSAGVLVLASQRANYLERAEKAEAERDELARTIDLLNVERSKAETALAECIRLSDAMAKHNDAYFIKSEALDAFRTWRAKQ